MIEHVCFVKVMVDKTKKTNTKF